MIAELMARAEARTHERNEAMREAATAEGRLTVSTAVGFLLLHPSRFAGSHKSQACPHVVDGMQMPCVCALTMLY